MADALIDQLAQLAESSGFELQDVLDEEKVQRVLEATAYDIETAGQLYWDDFLATRAMEQERQQQEQPELRDDDEEDGELEVEEEINDGVDEEDESTDGEEPRPRNPEEVPVLQHHQAIHSDDESAPPIDGDSANAVQLRRRLFVNPRHRKRTRRRRSEESIVSEEEEQEGVGSWTVVASAKTQSKLPATKRRRRARNALDDGYVSDNDWIWGDGQFASSPAALSKFIWGSGRDQPHPWLRAGLSICNKVGAVVLRPPHSQDLFYTEWTNAPAPTQPYHCRSLTTLTSVVNALLYSGATVQPGSCIGVAREPLLDVVNTMDDRQPREMTLRLMDAITVLIHIAAKASIDRKTAALKDAPADVRRRLQLVPVMSTSCEVSLTNLHDLPSYVKSNVQAFTSPGGLSRLMDTLVRIHGISTVRRCWPTPSLVKCTCCDRITATTKKDLELDTTPRDMDCLGGNDRLLVDWLLTGRVRPTTLDMHEQLGIGVLSDTGMTKPSSSSPCNVWLLQGPTQWSVLVQKNTDETDDDASLCRHINSWYREEHVTDVTVTHRKVCSTIDASTASESSREFIIHPDDPPLYPNRYRLWRYQFSSVWTPYVALTRAQQERVERQEGPALATLLQSRWPQARVDTDVTV